LISPPRGDEEELAKVSPRSAINLIRQEFRAYHPTHTTTSFTTFTSIFTHTTSATTTVQYGKHDKVAQCSKEWEMKIQTNFGSW
jgi:hypothetical protein